VLLGGVLVSVSEGGILIEEDGTIVVVVVAVSFGDDMFGRWVTG
jgi:hypothetical protein